jgi:hypothetical protein
MVARRSGTPAASIRSLCAPPMLSCREWQIAEDRDHPLVLRYSPLPDWLKPLDLPLASRRHKEALAQIAAIALDMRQTHHRTHRRI